MELTWVYIPQSGLSGQFRVIDNFLDFSLSVTRQLMRITPAAAAYVSGAMNLAGAKSDLSPV